MKKNPLVVAGCALGLLALLAAVPGPPSTPWSRGLLTNSTAADARTYLEVSSGGTLSGGTNNTLAKWTGATNLGSIANGAGILANDGSGSFSWTANPPDVTYTNVTVTTVNSTTINSTTINATVAKGGHLTITNEVIFPFATLTMSGSNISTMSLTNASAFKVTLTNNAFLGAPTDLPGTNFLQSFQLFVAQDGTGARTLTLTNGYWVVAGSGTSTNAVPSITTNANAVTILTFSTSPFANKAYGVVTPTGP